MLTDQGQPQQGPRHYCHHCLLCFPSLCPPLPLYTTHSHLLPWQFMSMHVNSSHHHPPPTHYYYQHPMHYYYHYCHHLMTQNSDSLQTLAQCLYTLCLDNDKNESLLFCQAINACCSMTQANPVWNGWSSESSAYHGKLNVDCYQSKHLLYLCQEAMAANCIILSMPFLSGQWLKCHIAVASGVLHPMWKVPG